MPQYLRRIIRVTALCSPNVRLALAEQAAGLKVSNRDVFEGVLSWKEYQTRLATWDEPRRRVGLEAHFWEGKDVLLFPPDWLDHSNKMANRLFREKVKRRARAMGVDPAEGKDFTSFAIVDEYGLCALHTEQTPNTNEVYRLAKGFIKRYNLAPDCVAFDSGGGGKQHADRLIEDGLPVRIVSFGESVAPNPQYGAKSVKTKIDEKYEKYSYLNRRAQMYWELAEWMDPKGAHGGFAIPDHTAVYQELRRQLAPIPRRYDDEGRIVLPPKRNKPGSKRAEPSLEQIIGRSPDDADALVLALFAMTHRVQRPTATMIGAGTV